MLPTEIGYIRSRGAIKHYLFGFAHRSNHELKAGRDHFDSHGRLNCHEDAEQDNQHDGQKKVRMRLKPVLCLTDLTRRAGEVWRRHWERRE